MKAEITRDLLSLYNDGSDEDFCKCIRELTELEDKAAKQEPIRVTDNPTRYPQVGVVHDYKCGMCGFSIYTPIDTKHINYCAKCGQKINWEVLK